jgi:hypothetical protein
MIDEIDQRRSSSPSVANGPLAMGSSTRLGHGGNATLAKRKGKEYYIQRPNLNATSNKRFERNGLTAEMGPGGRITPIIKPRKPLSWFWSL